MRGSTRGRVREPLRMRLSALRTCARLACACVS
nr:MAG TPA: hypothetical protein [Microviridae sp.]